MFNPGQELSSIDFGAMIGGPLNAVIKAQAQSARTTVDFIKEVGFEKGKVDENGNAAIGKPIYVSFKYDKEISPYQAATKENPKAVPAVYRTMVMEVPVLTIMPIPFIKVEDTTIEFNAKINSVSNTSETQQSNTSIESKSSVSYSSWWSPVKASTSLNASYSHQKQSSNSEEVKKDYSLNIKIHAVQDDMPAGMSKMLDVLEQSIISKNAAEEKKDEDAA